MRILLFAMRFLRQVSVEAASSLEAKMGRRTKVPEIAVFPFFVYLGYFREHLFKALWIITIPVTLINMFNNNTSDKDAVRSVSRIPR
jgi:hypothetical protein